MQSVGSKERGGSKIKPEVQHSLVYTLLNHPTSRRYKVCVDTLLQDCLASLLEIQNPGIFAELHDFESALST